MELCDQARGRSRRRGWVVGRALRKREAAAARGERNLHSEPRTKKLNNKNNMYKK